MSQANSILCSFTNGVVSIQKDLVCANYRRQYVNEYDCVNFDMKIVLGYPLILKKGTKISR